jgi:hypothetical protein
MSKLANCPGCGSGPAVPFSKGIGGQAAFSGVGVEQWSERLFSVDCGTCGLSSFTRSTAQQAVDAWEEMARSMDTSN